MRIVFMGTPEIAAAALEELLRLRPKHQVAAVYTRADKPKGRKQVITPSPVKRCALENGIPVLQPASMRGDARQAAESLRQWAPDLCVVVAYGLILPPEVLAAPRRGCVNLHVSLLPQYRGAAPVQWAVINGEKKTGVSVMQMDEGVDTGPVLAVREVDIGPDDTAGEVFERVTAVGARLLADTVERIDRGEAAPVPQRGEGSWAPRLTKPMAEIDFARPAAQLHNLVRGCSPWPLAWFASGGKRIKVPRTECAAPCGAKAGEVLLTRPLTVACGQGALVLEEVVPEGARPMTGAEWAAGRRFRAGDNILI